MEHSVGFEPTTYTEVAAPPLKPLEYECIKGKRRIGSTLRLSEPFLHMVDRQNQTLGFFQNVAKKILKFAVRV